MGFVRFNDLKECNVAVSFVNDSSIFYRLDVELYAPALGSSPFTVKDSEDAYGVGLIFTATFRIRSVNLVLGTGTQYDISFNVFNAVQRMRFPSTTNSIGGMGFAMTLRVANSCRKVGHIWTIPLWALYRPIQH